MDNQTTSSSSTIIAALSTLTPSQLSRITTTLSTTFHHHHRRLASLLSSPTLFTHTLNHLYSLSLPQKSLLIAHHLLYFFHLLQPFFPTFPPYSRRLRLRDLDSVLLLLYFCEIRQYQPNSLDTSPLHWHHILTSHFSDTVLKLSGLQMSSFDVLVTFVDRVVKCRRFVSAKGCGGDMARREMAASVGAVVALPSVEVKSGGECVECTICRVELGKERDVCELPCQHLFHWMCVLPWFSKRNTCPCCRFRLPTDDVYGELEQVWDAVVKIGRQISHPLENQIVG